MNIYPQPFKTFGKSCITRIWRDVVNNSDLPAGWYKESAGGQKKYWDGNSWLEVTSADSVSIKTMSSGAPAVDNLSVASLICAFAIPPLGVILGIMSRKAISASNGTKTGRKLATAAIWIGALTSFLIVGFLTILIVASTSQGSGDSNSSNASNQSANNTNQSSPAYEVGCTAPAKSGSSTSASSPVVSSDLGHAPKISQPVGNAPTHLVENDIVKGSGQTASSTSTLTVQYTLMSWCTGKVVESSWSGGQPATFALAQVIPGWQQGIPGMKEGGRRVLVIPPALGYGAAGGGPIGPNETLIFVVDLIKVA